VESWCPGWCWCCLRVGHRLLWCPVTPQRRGVCCTTGTEEKQAQGIQAEDKTLRVKKRRIVWNIVLRYPFLYSNIVNKPSTESLDKWYICSCNLSNTEGERLLLSLARHCEQIVLRLPLFLGRSSIRGSCLTEHRSIEHADPGTVS